MWRTLVYRHQYFPQFESSIQLRQKPFFRNFVVFTFIWFGIKKCIRCKFELNTKKIFEDSPQRPTEEQLLSISWWWVWFWLLSELLLYKFGTSTEIVLMSPVRDWMLHKMRWSIYIVFKKPHCHTSTVIDDAATVVVAVAIANVAGKNYPVTTMCCCYFAYPRGFSE